MMFMNNLLLRWKISQQQTFLYSDSLVGVETERMRLQSPLGMKKKQIKLIHLILETATHFLYSGGLVGV